MALELNGTTGVSLVQNGVITDANLPAGSVLQVVNATYSTQTSTTSSSYTDTGLTASITPSSASNKILVFANITGMLTVAAAQRIKLNIVRGSTQLIEFEKNAGYLSSSLTEFGFGGSSASYLDSPATTSSTTYKVQFAQQTGSSGVFICGSNCTSTITLMEIAA
jgi:hypothetical protein